jgi:hypothetical protein
VLDGIYALYDECRWGECIAACRKAIAAGREASVSEWYVVRTILASVAVKLEGSFEFQETVAVAIQGMEQIVDSGRLPSSDQRRGLAFRTLGYLYSKREQGEVVENHRRSVDCYEKAVSILRPDHAGQEWAEATVGLGTQLLERARMLTKEQIARDADEIASARSSVNAAISEFERALKVYTEKDHPDERQTTVELIGAAHEILNILNRQERLLH